MSSLLQFVLKWGAATWDMLLDSSLLLLIGLGLAGLIRLLLTEKKVSRFLFGGGPAPVFRAALLGIPLPLCSCSVLPVAHELRRSGVSKGGTIAFLISTPESGVDSIVLTYSLMNPVMTIARPITAFLTALTAGLIENRINPGLEGADESTAEAETDCGCDCESDKVAVESWTHRIWGGLKYAYTDLLADLAVYLLIGYCLAGLVAGLWGADAGGLPDSFRTGWGAYAGALLIGLPLYICALSSTPLAAALLASGFSPGATLVFLMVGPATNIATLVIVSKVLKGWAVARYLGSIVVVSIGCGLILDGLYKWYDFSTAFQFTSGGTTESTPWWHWMAAIILSAAIIWYPIRHLMARWSNSANSQPAPA